MNQSVPNLYRAQVIFPGPSGLPTDVATNTLWFGHDVASNPESDLVYILEALRVLYSDTGPTTRAALKTFIPSTWGPARVKVYDMSVESLPSEPRLPVYDQIESSIEGTNTGDALPTEVACTLSFYRAGSGSRNLGRIYLGPLAVNARSVVNSEVRVAPALRTAALAAMTDLRDGDGSNWGEDTVLKWVQFSPTNITWSAVTGGWVDDAFDTIRSRGPDPLVRETWGAPRTQ